MKTRTPSQKEISTLLKANEDHFTDLKSSDIAPAKLQECFVAFANADGGELWVGVEDQKVQGERLKGFVSQEAANGVLHTLLEQTTPAVENVEVEFLATQGNGFILHISVPKSTKVHYCANGDCYTRVNASKNKIKGERIAQLGYAKGALAYEKVPVEVASIEDYVESLNLYDYLVRIDTELEPLVFLRKQRLLTKSNNVDKPNVACVLLFDDEPQATLDTRCAVKVYRLLTSEKEYRREQLKEEPVTINGPLERQIQECIITIHQLLDNAAVTINGALEKFVYPSKAIHEILVNAIIHRDYSLNDDIHIRIYDNRIEIISPGRLPGYITINNIYEERFSRNPNLVRLLHNLPNPVNHDIGEGLDTARNEMKRVGLVDPIIEELDNSVRITIKHKKLASLEEVILNYSRENSNSAITNKIVREISGEDDVNKVKKAFQKLRAFGKVVPVDEEASAFDFSYRLP